MEYTTSNWIVIIIYHAINLFFAIYIGETIIRSINESDDRRPSILRKKRKNLFSDEEENIAGLQDTSLNRPVLILAALLPFFIMSTIYFTILDHLYDFITTSVEQSGKKIFVIYLLSFFGGLSMAKIFLNPKNKNNSFYKHASEDLLQIRLSNVEIFYLSTTLCVIIFSYLDFSVKVNIIKGAITFFLIGNSMYLVFRQDIKFPSWLTQYFDQKIK